MNDKFEKYICEAIFDIDDFDIPLNQEESKITLLDDVNYVISLEEKYSEFLKIFLSEEFIKNNITEALDIFFGDKCDINGAVVDIIIFLPQHALNANILHYIDSDKYKNYYDLKNKKYIKGVSFKVVLLELMKKEYSDDVFIIQFYDKISKIQKNFPFITIKAPNLFVRRDTFEHVTGKKLTFNNFIKNPKNIIYKLFNNFTMISDEIFVEVEPHIKDFQNLFKKFIQNIENLEFTSSDFDKLCFQFTRFGGEELDKLISDETISISDFLSELQKSFTTLNEMPLKKIYKLRLSIKFLLKKKNKLNNEQINLHNICKQFLFIIMTYLNKIETYQKDIKLFYKDLNDELFFTHYSDTNEDINAIINFIDYVHDTLDCDICLNRFSTSGVLFKFKNGYKFELIP